MSSFQKMLKQAQVLQQQVQSTQKQLTNKEYSHSCQGVDVVVKGDMSLVSLKISPELLKETDRELLQDVLQVAINGALSKARQEMEDKMGEISGSLGLPNLF